MDPPRYVLYSVLLLCAFAGYSLAEPSWVSVENAGEKMLTGEEKDLNLYIEVRSSNMNPTLIDIATRIMSSAYATLDNPYVIRSYWSFYFEQEAQLGLNWNTFVLCGGFRVYTDYYISLAVYANGVLSSEYLLISI